MYLPALPRIAEEFSESTAHVQLTLSLILLGFAVAQLFYGVLPDRLGRKPVMLAGLMIFTVATIGCAYSENIYSLMGCYCWTHIQWYQYTDGLDHYINGWVSRIEFCFFDK